MAADFLSQNKAVLLEKPFTFFYHDAEALIKLAENNHTLLMAGHLMEYHPVVLKLAALMGKGQMVPLRYMLLECTNLGKY
ncbi:oxidoreductase, Gfo/Idh/MocA family/transferase hexapeptide repeat protein [Desulforamulus reducens MI-1]|uniref:Oxidoreductase, Gfo/Idh/MocA family/transferase hexapeptide repeat protein n=1 Tax=Desulforamulus reducens (strain ATCC BAA-1160 / DSM 100696 / MI-1) TaxID=349161 RepID=A4J9J8_DESRM|nr:Gfo/Idh/MocA family oxidoreductase [Desulforamulus reducens]ABO51751.1 oxidoreductase, Gfo/Idh/MocA family/transferase hexapeptide repeat protein [Desulforamulus reducens MI-1]